MASLELIRLLSPGKETVSSTIRKLRLQADDSLLLSSPVAESPRSQSFVSVDDDEWMRNVQVQFVLQTHNGLPPTGHLDIVL